MITELGIVAGEIWHFLDKHEDGRLSILVKSLGRKRDILLMSTGWLAREGHVVLSETEGGDYILNLRK